MTETPDKTVTYVEALARFSPAAEAASLSGSLADGINVCVECCDRHAAGGGMALIWESQDGRRGTVTFAELRARAARFANLLARHGVGRGDVVAGMLPRTPDLLTVILGTWRAGAVYQPLFTAFGPKAIEQRFDTSEARLVVTNAANRAKLDDVANCPPVVMVDAPRPSDIDFHAALAAEADQFEPVMLTGEDRFLMMSTSGTTGAPKGVPVPIKALLSFQVYMRDAVDLRPEDVFWNIADPGWAYGLYYAVTGPLLMGHATTFYDGPFTADSTYAMIARYGITNLAGAPTAYRLLMAAGPAAAEAVKGRLRVVSSAGEPLNPAVITWFRDHLAVPIHDHYGQTETGMVVVNHHRLKHAIHAGSAGLATPGIRIVVLSADGRELPPGEPGELATDLARSPLHWFSGYWKKETPSIAGGYYRSGDFVQMEPDGTFTYVGRSDDVITSSGYRIGPFDVESALVEHSAVIEAAVIGVPDAQRTEIVKAFVVLADTAVGDAALAEELRLYVKGRLSAHAYPRDIEFVTQLPKTPSGKVQRFLLRQAEIDKIRKADA